MNIGIDIGRVIIGPVVGGREDTSFLGTRLEEALHTPPAEGAFAVIHDLVEATRGRTWLVSKAGPSVQRKTRAWLAHNGFHARTGLPEEHVRFCLKRHEKAAHCAELGIECFIDDRVDVLGHLRGLVRDLLLFGEQPSPAPRWATHVTDWQAVREWFHGKLGA